MRRIWRPMLLAVLLLAAFAYLNNGGLTAPRLAGPPTLLAHRGIAQRFDMAGLTNDTCTAARMLPPRHAYLENTIASMRASFEAGADVVELDIHPTTDGRFAVFHDWTLDCRTDGRGITREHSMAELQRLDIGHSYTADGGRSFPFRGQGIGLMPALDEVLEVFPDRRFLINIKSDDAAEGERLAAWLGQLPPATRDRLMVYGGDRPIATLRAALRDLRTVSRGSLRACLLRYAAYGWTGLVPTACAKMLILVPVNIAPWLWGWPGHFLQRMQSVGGSVFVIGPYHGGAFSTGIDTPEDLARLPAGYPGGILTNEIEVIAAALGLSRAVGGERR
ncbi:glycerophosphodiester phosphodiesterase [Roseomonas hellenica]|nr:glycerophosphodiester phosphodiesterase [Plastoroseomonas hellenica]